MLEYIDDLGQTYTENDINRMAAEQKISADDIIKNKKLILLTEIFMNYSLKIQYNK
jgi:hypothetical protein